VGAKISQRLGNVCLDQQVGMVEYEVTHSAVSWHEGMVSPSPPFFRAGLGSSLRLRRQPGLTQHLPDPLVDIYQRVQRPVQLLQLAADPGESSLSVLLADLGMLVKDKRENRHEDACAGGDDGSCHQPRLTHSRMGNNA
jgi:hypothetical protein